MWASKGHPRVERRNNFDTLRLLAATSVIFSHEFLLATGQQDTEPLMVLTGGQTIGPTCAGVRSIALIPASA